MQTVAGARPAVLVPGIELCSLVGSHNGARNLFTGLLTLAPDASYPFYSRPFTEVSLLLDGQIAVDVADRRYRLGPPGCDNNPGESTKARGESFAHRSALSMFRWPHGTRANLDQWPFYAG